jgi:glutamate carboxypeptidase
MLQWLDLQKDKCLERLERWVGINSYSTNLQGLEQMRRAIEEDFKILNGTYQHISLSYPSTDQILTSKALIIRSSVQASFRILFAGHYDTVHDQKSHFNKVEKSSSQRWKGPGIADMKGGLAVLLLGLEAFQRSSASQSLGWDIILTPDEEIGSPGSESLYRQLAKQYNIGIIFEPSFPDGAFVSKRAGSANFEIAFHGTAAHVGRDYEKGKSAVLAIAHFIAKVEKLALEKDLICNVSDLEGMGPLNIVPPFARCRINIRSDNGNRMNLMHDSINLLAKEVADQRNISFELKTLSFRMPKEFDTPTKQLFGLLAECAGDLKIPFQLRSTRGVCDGNILASEGLPTIDSLGVVGAGLHTEEEYVEIESIIERSKLFFLFLMKLASKETHLRTEQS